MPATDPLPRLLQEAAKRLAAAQLPDGSFASLSSPILEGLEGAIPCRTTFATAVILGCLQAAAPVPGIARVRRRAAAFLLAERTPAWSWNYWARTEPERERRPYPDDLDDTSLALAALSQERPDAVDGSALASATSLLTAVETAPGGPYRTWLVRPDSKEAWLDVDPAVNANVAWLLSLHRVRLEPLDAYLDKQLAGACRSPYYPSEHAVLYYMARGCRAEARAAVVRRLLALRSGGGWGSPLRDALAMSGLIRCGHPVADLEPTAARLISQGPDWPAEGFCLDPSREGQAYYAGSEALTAAFCLEALALWQAAASPKKVVTRGAEEQLRGRILANVSRRQDCCEPELRRSVEEALGLVLPADAKTPILLLPAAACQALGLPLRGREALLAQLGAATLWGWLAYTVYDGFLDDAGRPDLLPAANLALRELTALLHDALPGCPEWRPFFHAAMDRLESANAWELVHCRVPPPSGTLCLAAADLPDYADPARLYQRSLGHLLGPVAVLAAAGYGPASPESQALQRFFEHFLAARQLNDDAHDWEEDLAAGQLNAAAALLLREHMESQAAARLEEDWETLLPKLQRLFWRQTILRLTERIETHLEAAEAALASCRPVSRPARLRQLLVPLRAAAERTRRERSDALQFIAAYAAKEAGTAA